MYCLIADLVTDVPIAGDLFSRCEEYISENKQGADITIRTELFRENEWQGLSKNDFIYLESGVLFYTHLLNYNGLMLHSSAVEFDGRAYLFSGDCGVGKSTHTRLWQNVFGEEAKVFNDDKPALRFVENKWYAYGTPWCGKDGININMRAPVAGICFLKQAEKNHIRLLEPREAVKKIISQTTRQFYRLKNLELMLNHVDNLVKHIPIFELENRPEPEAAILSYETMRKTAEEMGL